MILSARGASAPVAADTVKAREVPKQERQAPKARGGFGGHRGGSRTPPAVSRMDNIRPDMNNKVARPAGDIDESELRKDAALREMAEYIREVAPKNDSKFDFLQYWEARGTDGVDPSGKVVVPAHWPHIGLLASDMRAGTLAHKTRRCSCSDSTGPLFPDLRG